VTDTTKARTAHHEAAHAVVAAIRDIPIRYATIRPRRALNGVTVLRHRKAEPPWEDYCAVLAAGPIADDIYTGMRRRPDLARPIGDYELLRTAAREVRQETRAGKPPPGIEVSRKATVRAIAAIAWQQAHADLTGHYGAVLAVAERLLSSRRTLTGAEVRHLVATAPALVGLPRCAQFAAEFWPSWFMTGWWVPERTRSAADRRPARALNGEKLWPAP